jgi:deoxyribonuclease-1|tara:strand:+ start:188 stop:364 length:177 start_codon:yes stop_codon:yes gene_type:complete
MHDRYGVVFQIGELEMFQSWNETDPVSDWEIERDRRIVQVQGFGNPWVENSAHSVAGN